MMPPNFPSDVYKTFFESSMNAMLLLSTEGIILLANPAAESILLRTNSSLIDTNISKLLSDDTSAVTWKIAEEQTCAEPGKQEISLVRGDGSHFMAEVITKVHVEDNNALLVAVVVQDISERIKVGHMLQAQAKPADLLARTVALANVGGWQVDLATMKLSWTQETFRIAEIDPPDEPPLEEGINLFAPEARPSISEAVQAAMDFGTPYDLELPLITAKGRHLWVRTQGYGEIIGGKVTRIYGTFQDITDRRRMEQALRTSEESLRFAIEGSGDGVWDWDLVSGRVIYSARWLEMLGYEKGDIGHFIDGWRKIAYPDDLYRVLSDVQTHLDGKTVSFTSEYRLLSKDGSWKWVLGRGFVVERDKTGTPLRMIGMNSDITHRKLSDIELVRSKNALNEAQRIAHMGSWELDNRTNQMSWSDELYRIYRLDPASPPPGYLQLQKLVTATSWAKLDAAVQESLATGRSYELELETIRNDGTRGWLWVRGEVVSDAHGEPQGLRGAALDITERKRSQAALHRYELVVKSISQGVIVTGADRLIVSANEAFSAITGYSDSEIIGRDCKFLFGPMTDPDTTASIRNALDNAQSFAGEIQNHRKDGTPFWNDLTISPVFNELGTLTHFIGVTRDITQRKKSELELSMAAAAFSAQEGIIITDADQRILRVNAAFENISGYKQEEVLGKNPSIMSSGIQDSHFYRQMWTCIEESGLWHGEIWDRRKNGEIFPQSVTISVVRSADGHVTNYVGTFIDVSNIKKAEEAISKLSYYDTLTGLVNRNRMKSVLESAIEMHLERKQFGGLLRRIQL